MIIFFIIRRCSISLIIVDFCYNATSLISLQTATFLRSSNETEGLGLISFQSPLAGKMSLIFSSLFISLINPASLKQFFRVFYGHLLSCFVAHPHCLHKFIPNWMNECMNILILCFNFVVSVNKISCDYILNQKVLIKIFHNLFDPLDEFLTNVCRKIN